MEVNGKLLKAFDYTLHLPKNNTVYHSEGQSRRETIRETKVCWQLQSEKDDYIGLVMWSA